jgi:hypothetical protein
MGREAMAGENGRLHSGEKFWIDRGDGDQNYFSAPIGVVLTEASWFPPDLRNFGEALLFVVEGGTHSGEYIAATSNGYGLREKLSVHGYSTAIIWRIANSTPTYDQANSRDLENIGMSIVWRTSQFPMLDIDVE